MKLVAISFLFFFGVICKAGRIKTYYVAIKEIYWDYASSKMNNISGKSIADDEQASTFLLNNTNRIGRIYKKAVYLQYTDDSYKVEIKKPNWLGFLGPIFRAEVGDTIIVHLKNFASRAYSLHPHGVEYTKEKEGALYPDNNPELLKKGADVKPGDSYTYKWDAVLSQGPTEMEDDCVIRTYHSHIETTHDVYSGLVGALLICKEGYLDKGKYKSFEEFVMMFSVVDENLSWYLDDNIKTFCTDPDSVDKEDESFQESNKMHSINGYMFGNLPGLSMCNNKKVKWYMFGMGNEVDIHSVYFYGQVLTLQHYRVDTINLFPATMVQGEMITDNIGKWLLTCQVNDHLEGGMQAIYEVRSCTEPTRRRKSSPQAHVRHYYIAAEQVLWNYGPSLTNHFTGEKLDDPESESAIYFEQTDMRIGGSYKKVVYVEYKDATFTKRKKRSAEEKHLGILGPVIQAQVGDVVRVTFRNNAKQPYSIQAHGVSYTKTMEGALYRTSEDAEAENDASTAASHVAPGGTFTYEWDIPESVGPDSNDLNCLPWIYFSSVDPIKDTNTGLVGPLLVCNNLIGNKQISHNFFMLATIFDENKSWLLDENIKFFTNNSDNVDKEDPEFQESNKMHSINGYMFGNQPGLDMCIGDTVLWHMMGIGNEVDMHGIHFTGNTFKDHSGRRDTASIFPHISYSVTMKPDNEGIFDVECMTADHFVAGMKQHYGVKACRLPIPDFSNKVTQTYYISAEEVEWDYSPNRTWEHELYKNQDESPGDIFLNQGNSFIGSKYIKALYREYTDKTFATPKQRTTKNEHMGLLGPLIKANVGEKIKIIFHNKASRPYSIYAHGVKMDGDSVEAAEPGETKTYIWSIPARSGPSRKGDLSCITWAYYSNVNQVKDMYSGLIGALLICKQSSFNDQPLERSHLEFPLLFMIFDENQSWYLDENIQTFSKVPNSVNKEDEDFIESNKMHGVNGKLYANLHGLTMQVGDHITWYLIGMGNKVDLHTVHFHAHSFQYKVTIFSIHMICQKNTKWKTEMQLSSLEH
ncbi:ceruloplasmin [Pelobates cultripes]|uniref:ferroxidase n=1 Tax=Pelobates cultripes TaxID=61616 RepID=A0AAD1RAV1_PELCU|nr:ceruloplasmin [Pelobates cultripes]